MVLVHLPTLMEAPMKETTSMIKGMVKELLLGLMVKVTKVVFNQENTIKSEYIHQKEVIE